MSRIDAFPKVSGEVAYTADVGGPDLCHVVLVRSPYSHARINHIDVNRALAVPGVLGVFTAKDFPERHYGVTVQDVPVIARDEVRYVGERVAAVVAEDRATAERAAALVEVGYQPLAAVTTINAAMAAGAPAVHVAPWTFAGAVATSEDGVNRQWRSTRQIGDLAAGWSRTAFAVDCRYTTPAIHQGYIEPHAYVCRVDEDGKHHLWIPNKSPYGLRQQLSACLQIEAGAIEIHPMPIGGDFGGKGTPMDAPLCLWIAERLGRPVKMVLRHAEDLAFTNPRHDADIHIRLGCDVAGRLTVMEMEARFNGGAYAGLKPGGDIKAPLTTGEAYRIPAVRIVAERLYTHTVPRGNMRSPGAPQMYFAWESAVDELAAQAQIDPIQFRRLNLLETGETAVFGMAAEERRWAPTLDAALAAFRPRPAPAGWLTGTGMAVYHRETHVAKMSVRVQIQADRTAVVWVPIPETGTGSHTVAQKAFAQALGLALDDVSVRQVSTDHLPPAAGIGGSRATAGLWAAAARIADLVRADPAAGEWSTVVEPGHTAPVIAYCVEMAEVAVDPQTGQLRVLQLVAAVDAARVVNPLTHRIQIEGGMVMGFGGACLEDLRMEEGRPEASTLAEYKLPSLSDVPPLTVVVVPGGRGVGPANIKSVGELSNVPTAAAIANAVASAVGIRIRDLPITAEKLFMAAAAAAST